MSDFSDRIQELVRMGRDLYEEDRMRIRRKKKYIHEGEYVAAAVSVELC